MPWIGVMMAGYGFGLLLTGDAAKRKKCCLWIGLSCIAAFIVIGCIVTYFHHSKSGMPFLFRLLAQQKYPPSQLYLLMTLGPLIALVPFAEKAKGWFANILVIFGRVPFFYYILHILLIHVSALVVNFIRTGNPHQDWYGTAPYLELAENQRWGLPILYFDYFILVVILYFVCRSYARYKFSHPEKKWLKYL